MTTVSVGIAEAYKRDFGVEAAVVTNAPRRAGLRPTPVHEPIRILHHGAAQRGRGIEEMLDVASLLDSRFTLDLMLVESSPGFRKELVHRARRNERIRFPPPVPMRDLPHTANAYDVGLYLLPPNNFNKRHALPNKFFEFIQGRLAVAVGPSPEMAGIVRRYGCGVVAPDFAPSSLAAVLNRLDPAHIATLKDASHVAAQDLCAEHNSVVISEAVERALSRRSA